MSLEPCSFFRSLLLSCEPFSFLALPLELSSLLCSDSRGFLLFFLDASGFLSCFALSRESRCLQTSLLLFSSDASRLLPLLLKASSVFRSEFCGLDPPHPIIGRFLRGKPLGLCLAQELALSG